MPDRPIAILAALDMEAGALARHLASSNAPSPGVPVWEGEIEGKPVVLAVTGVGKVAGAMATQFLCDAFHPSCVVVVGLAGAADAETPRGRLIVASGAAQHDVDARPLAPARGVLPGWGMAIFPSDASLSEKLWVAAGRTLGGTAMIRSGVVLTGDQIVTSRKTRDRLTAEFGGAACVDMETAAIAQVAQRNGVPWTALRITSDSADESFDLDEVLRFGSSASELLDRVIHALVREL